MRRWCRCLGVVGLSLALATPAFARVAMIQTTARLADHSDDGVRAAVRDAVETAVRGARAMGLSHVALQDVSRLDDETVAIRLVASDAEGDEPDGSQPDHPQPDRPQSGGHQSTGDLSDAVDARVILAPPTGGSS